MSALRVDIPVEFRSYVNCIDFARCLRPKTSLPDDIGAEMMHFITNHSAARFFRFAVSRNNYTFLLRALEQHGVSPIAKRW